MLLPSIPRLVTGRDLKGSDEAVAEGELASVIGAVYDAGASGSTACAHGRSSIR